MIPLVNLSISGYEPDSLRTSNMRSLPVQAPGTFYHSTIR